MCPTTTALMFLTQFPAKILRSLQQTAAEPPNWWERTERQPPRDTPGPLGDTFGVPLDVTGDILCKEQKQSSQQKAMEVDKRPRSGLIIRELRESSGERPPPHLPKPSRPIRPGDAPLYGMEAGDPSSSLVEGLESKMSNFDLFSSWRRETQRTRLMI